MAIRMTAEAAEKVRTRFRGAARDLEEAGESLATFSGDLSTAAGEFRQDLNHESADFRGSWKAVYDTCADAAALVAGNTNALYVDLLALDDEASTPTL